MGTFRHAAVINEQTGLPNKEIYANHEINQLVITARDRPRHWRQWCGIPHRHQPGAALLSSHSDGSGLVRGGSRLSVRDRMAGPKAPGTIQWNGDVVWQAVHIRAPSRPGHREL